MSNDLKQQIDCERKRLKSIQEIARALGSTLDRDELLRQIVASITDMMDAERSTLYLIDWQSNQLWTKVLEADELTEIRLAIGEGIAGWVAKTGETVNIADAYGDERFSRDVDQQTGYRTRSILCIPMRDIAGEIVGVAQVLNKKQNGTPGTFTSEDENLLEALVSQAAIAIANSHLYQSVVDKNAELISTHRALQRRMAEMDLLLEVQQEISRAVFVDDLLDRLLERVGVRMGVEAASVLLKQGTHEISSAETGLQQSSLSTADGPNSPVKNSKLGNNGRTGRFFFRSVSGEAKAQLKRLSFAIGEGIAGWVTKHDKPVLVNDPKSDPRHCRDIAQKTGLDVRNILCVPLRGRDGVLGAIELVNRIGASGFDKDDELLLTLVAGRVAQSIELAQYHEQQIRENRLASIGQLLSGVVHDLRTPLTIISGCVQLMAESTDQAERTSFAEQIQRQFELMSSMTKEVLAFAKGESNLLIRKVYVNRFIAEIKQQLVHEFSDKGIELHVDARYQGVAYFDENKLRRVFHNVARNASQAMSNGGTFEIIVDRGADVLLLEFADNGGGIPEEVEGRLFDAFATAGKQDGSGLGLAIVKRIVEEHQGTIDYQSTRGKGTTFKISLPLTRREPTGALDAPA